MKKEAKYKEYHILIEDNNSVKILSSEEPLTPVKPKLREIAEEINFDVEESWNTQTLGSKLVDHLHKMSECQKNQGKAIVINRMYVGDYLSSNLGHEVINMYTADNGNHYLYLNAYGNFSKEHTDKVGYMLLAKYYAEGVLEVIGKAEGLTDVSGANTPLPKNYKVNIPNISDIQREYIEEIENITYGEVPLLEIFHGAEQQNIFVTYKAQRLYIPKSQVLISYGDIDGVKADVVLCGYNQANTSLKTYIYKEGTFVGDQTKPDEATKESRRQDYNKLINLINQNDLWKEYIYKIDKKTLKEEHRKISLFDICQIQNSENCFSNALAYFMQEDCYKDLWDNFFKSKIELDFESCYWVKREIDIKTNIKNLGGGRIDIMVCDSPYLTDAKKVIVIENKIKSDINRKESDKEAMEEKNQLHRYKEYLEKWLRSKEWLNTKGTYQNRAVKYIVLSPEYNQPTLEEGWDLITYKDLYKFLGDNENIWTDDSNMRSFYEAMYRHTHDNVNDYLYYEMQEKLKHRIYEYHKRNPQL